MADSLYSLYGGDLQNWLTNYGGSTPTNNAGTTPTPTITTQTTTPSDAAGELPEYNYDQLEWARELFSGLLQPATGVSTGYADSLNSMLSNMNLQLPQYVNFLNQIVPAYNTLMGQSQADFGNISDVFTNWMNEAKGLYGDALNQASSIMPTIYQLLGQGMNTIGGGTDLLSQARNILSGITDKTQGGLNAWETSFWDSLSNVGNVNDLISNLISSGSSTLQQYAPELWGQYGDLYNQMGDSYQNVLSGTLPPETQQLLDNLFNSQYNTALQQTQEWQTDQQRRLIDDLANRGVLTSGEAAQTLGYVDQTAQQRLMETRNNLLSQQYQAALALPYQQFETMMKQFQAPTTGANIAQLTSEAYQALQPYLQTALQGAVAPSTIGSSFLGSLGDLLQTELGAGTGLSNTGLAYGDLGNLISSNALNYLQPSTLLSQLASNFGNLGTSYAGTEYGASSQLSNILGGLLNNAVSGTNAGYTDLFNTLMSQPGVLNQGLQAYGGLSQEFTQLLVSEYLKRLETEAYLAAAKMQADAANANADAAGDASMWGAIGSIIGGLF